MMNFAMICKVGRMGQLSPVWLENGAFLQAILEDDPIDFDGKMVWVYVYPTLDRMQSARKKC